jgi:hypothetical protein
MHLFLYFRCWIAELVLFTFVIVQITYIIRCIFIQRITVFVLIASLPVHFLLNSFFVLIPSLAALPNRERERVLRLRRVDLGLFILCSRLGIVIVGEVRCPAALQRCLCLCRSSWSERWLFFSLPTVQDLDLRRVRDSSPDLCTFTPPTGSRSTSIFHW